MKLKFNLNFGSEQVRTIQDVRTQAINAREILSEIIKTFQENEETDPAYVEVDFSLFNYFDGGNKFRADFNPAQLSQKLDSVLEQGSEKVIQEYFRGYEALVQDIISHPDDLTYIEEHKQWHSVEKSGKKYLIFLCYNNDSDNEFTIASPENHDKAFELKKNLSCRSIIFNGIDLKNRHYYSSPYFYYMEAR